MRPNDPIRELFDRIITRHSELIRRTCRFYTSSFVSEDDLYQEVMLVLWRGLKSFRGEASLTTWLYRTTINTCISYLRTVARHSNMVSIDDEASNSVAVDNPIYDSDDYKRLHELIDELNPIDKAIVTLWLNEEPYDRIAEVTGLSRSNVATKLNRIKKRLKNDFR